MEGAGEENKKVGSCYDGFDLVIGGNVCMFRKWNRLRLGCMDSAASFVYLYYFLLLGLISFPILFLFIFFSYVLILFVLASYLCVSK